MDQAALFHDNENDALVADITAIGGHKKVAGMLWPVMKLDSAYARLKNCLRDDKAEKLEFCEIIQIIYWAKDFKSFATINYITDTGGFERAKPRDPEDAKDELKRAFIESVKYQQQILKRFEELGAK